MSAPFKANPISFFYFVRLQLAVAVVVLNVADVVTTKVALSGGATEANPILQPHVDGWVWVVLKLALATLFAHIGYEEVGKNSRVAGWAMIIAVAFYSVVVGMNLATVFS